MPELLNLVAIIIIFGLLMWVINVFIPMPVPIKSLLNVVVLLVLIVYVLQFFGLVHTGLPHFQIFH